MSQSSFGCENSGVHSWSGDVRAVLAAAGLHGDARKATNECGTEVTPSIGAVTLGDPIGEAVVVVTEDCACYGIAGAHLAVLASAGGNWIPILRADGCGLQVKSTRHLGAPDLLPVVMPCVMANAQIMNPPAMKWNGHSYDGSAGIGRGTDTKATLAKADAGPGSAAAVSSVRPRPSAAK